MKAKIILFVLLISVTKSVNCQITKGYWLVGGNGSFNKERLYSDIEHSTTYIFISANVGYFLIDKLAIGLRPSYKYNHATFASNRYYTIAVAPFARYYFLKPEKTLNLFAEVNYAFENFVVKENGERTSSKANTFNFIAGPVIFFNPSVALELTFAYSIHTARGFGKTYDVTQIGIGFQFHLTKDN